MLSMLEDGHAFCCQTYLSTNRKVRKGPVSSKSPVAIRSKSSGGIKGSHLFKAHFLDWSRSDLQSRVWDRESGAVTCL